MALTARQKTRRARRNGVLLPSMALKAAKVAEVPYYMVCAFLIQETSGGRNVYGHDGGPDHLFFGHGDVTPCNYGVYRIEADRSGNRQGVGPMQLTHKSYQDRADELGGCERPYFNILTACEAFRGWLNEGLSEREIAKRYNGTDAYADKMVKRFDFWREVMS